MCRFKLLSFEQHEHLTLNLCLLPQPSIPGALVASKQHSRHTAQFMTDSSNFYFIFAHFESVLLCFFTAKKKNMQYNKMVFFGFFFACSHRSRDDERISKPASTPAKLPEDVPLPKAKESAVAREDKQLPPLPGQRWKSGH